MNEIRNILDRQKAFFETDATKSVDYRVEMLKKLDRAVRENEERILTALYLDLGKSRAEGYMSEIAIVYGEIREAIRKVRKWSRPKKAGGVLNSFPSRSYVYTEPYGSVLILAPWNYPFNLAVAPLVGAVAAGNCAMVKCSRHSIHTSAVIREILNSAFEEEYIYCIDADADYDEVLRQPYDYIFFTGSQNVGKTVMAAAAENLIPVSLELGGKSPCIIDETADLKLAAKRIAWGKFLNAGQTCVAVDYVLVQNSVKEAFVEALEKEIGRRYRDAVRSDAYPKIITPYHYRRLTALIETEDVVIGGECNDLHRKIGPTIFPEADFDHEIMKEEIFGPLLPVIGYEDPEEAIRKIREGGKPLACYIFTSNRQAAEHFIGCISFGGGCVNDVILHIANHHLPFGGVGASGIGGYHGKYSFETFSHRKGVLKSGTLVDMPLRYAPFDERKLDLLKMFLR